LGVLLSSAPGPRARSFAVREGRVCTRLSCSLMDEIVVEERYSGFPGTAPGGYVAGLLGRAATEYR